MTAKERDELLIRLDERTQNTEEKVKKIDLTLHGNGNPEKGLSRRFDRVENNQQICNEQKKQKKLDAKWVVITIIALTQLALIIYDKVA